MPPLDAVLRLAPRQTVIMLPLPSVELTAALESSDRQWARNDHTHLGTNEKPNIKSIGFEGFANIRADTAVQQVAGEAQPLM